MQYVVKKIIEIIRNNFINGIRDDFIDVSKVLRIYSASYGNENISREFISNVIYSNGIEDGGRYYFISENDEAEIKSLFDDILRINSIVYYSAVYKKYSDFFTPLHIFSPEILRKILRVTNTYFCFAEFCSTNRGIRLDYEVSGIFMAAGKSLSLEDLQEKLPYVPSEKILAVLSDIEKFLRTNTGKYIPVSKVQFDAEEIQSVKRQITLQIESNGYATAEDYDLSSNFDLNPEIAEKDLRNVIYEKFFSAEFTKRGMKLFRKGDVAKRNTSDSTQSLREFISEYKELSVEKLFAFAESLGFSKKYATVSLSVAHEMMIRVEKDLFVEDSLISFDVAGVDEALTSFVQGKIIPLRGVTSFTGFPPVAGYSWNLFLLESFLRRFSQKYSFDTSAANNANIGAIYPKSMKFEDYLDVQARAVLQEKIPLEKSAVESFLINQGFRAKRLEKTTVRIISHAQEILNK